MSSKANLIVGALLLLCWSFALTPISGYEEVKLTQFTPTAYSTFIEAVRNAIPNNGQKDNGQKDGIRFLPVKPEPPTEAPSKGKGKGKPIAKPEPKKWDNEYLLVTLKADDNTPAVTFALQMTDLYVAGYKVGTNAWIFKDFKSEREKIFPEVTSNNKADLTYESGYKDLEMLAGDRRQISLGIKKLKEAAYSLATTPPGRNSGSQKKAKEISESLIVVIEMVSEAVRFKYIANEIIGYGETNRYPNKEMLEYENNWNKDAVRGRILDAAPGTVPEKLVKDVYIIKPPK